MNSKFIILFLFVTSMQLCIAPHYAKATSTAINFQNSHNKLVFEYTELPFDSSIKFNQDSVTWTQYHHNNFISKTNTDYKKFFLRSNFTSFNISDDVPYYIIIRPTFYITKIYLNGTKIIQRGKDFNNANERNYLSDYYTLPTELLKKDGTENQLLIELKTFRGYTGFFSKVELSQLDYASKVTRIQNFFNIDIPKSLLITGIIIFIFFLFISRSMEDKSRYKYLIFAFLALTLGGTFIDKTMSSDNTNFLLFEKISTCSMSLMSLGFLLFAIYLFELWKENKDKNKIIISVIALLLAISFGCFLCKDVKSLWTYFEISMFLYVLPSIGIMIFTSIYFQKKKSNNIYKSLNFILFAFLFGTIVDVFHFTNPYSLWITPFLSLIALIILLLFLSLDFGKNIKELNLKKEELYAQNLGMEEVIRVRTNELKKLNKNLSKSIEELKLANTQKDKFFSIMAHDIKNPLNSIIGFSELLNDDYSDLTEEQRLSYINHICNGVENLGKLLENISEWSRSQTGRMVCTPILINLTQLIEDVLISVNQQACTKRIKIKSNYPLHKHFYADENMIKSILRNLVGNAIKFSYEGATIQIVVKFEDDQVKFKIIDEGIGLSEKRVHDIFTPSQLASTDGTCHEKGTGLGLMLCKEFVEMHKGAIEVSSTIGKGSTFAFVIPYK